MRRVALPVAAVLALVAVATGVFLAMSDDREATTGAPTEVDIGFAQDMIVHHQQAVVMAAYTRERTASDEVRAMAGTIDAAQQREIGQMTGWLQSWGEPIQSDRLPMAWMADGEGAGHGHHAEAGSMPGMASAAEMDQLVNLTGARLDARFLQLMTRHHEGGLPMAKEAATRAGTTYVRATARIMVSDQQREIDLMRMLLQSRSASSAD
jgi:uncharacterized protein (DUF305 family)